MIILGIIVERLITYLDDNGVNPGRLLKKLRIELNTKWLSKKIKKSVTGWMRGWC
jgi:hypothetical protein